jgi:hypothetical protein
MTLSPSLLNSILTALSISALSSLGARTSRTTLASFRSFFMVSVVLEVDYQTMLLKERIRLVMGLSIRLNARNMKPFNEKCNYFQSVYLR